MTNNLDKIVDNLVEEAKNYQGLEGVEFTADDALCVVYEIEQGKDYKDAVKAVLDGIQATLDKDDDERPEPDYDDSYFGATFLHNTDERIPMESVETLKSNAKTLGLETLLECAEEECAELVQAICKFKRAHGHGQPTEVTKEAAIANLIEELSDVKICIDAILHVSGYDLVPTIVEKSEKVRRRYEKKAEEANG